jgi:hypothetical protein
MPAATKQQVNTHVQGFTISNEVKDHGNDPYFVKKNKQAKAFIKKHGFPKELLYILKDRMPV